MSFGQEGGYLVIGEQTMLMIIRLRKMQIQFSANRDATRNGSFVVAKPRVGRKRPSLDPSRSVVMSSSFSQD